MIELNPYITQPMKILRVSKSLVVRLEVPLIHFKEEFNTYVEDLFIVFDAVQKMYDFIDRIDFDTNQYRLINKG